MPSYDLTIQGPHPATFIVSAFDDEAAESLICECLQLDYAGESDPAVLATRISLVASASGQAVLDAQLADVLHAGGGGVRSSNFAS